MVVRGRLWTLSNPQLAESKRDALVSELMDVRRAVKAAKGDAEGMKLARQRVDAAKIGLGERGPVWWSDGEPDYNRKLATSYREWFKRWRVLFRVLIRPTGWVVPQGSLARYVQAPIRMRSSEDLMPGQAGSPPPPPRQQPPWRSPQYELFCCSVGPRRAN